MMADSCCIPFISSDDLLVVMEPRTDSVRIGETQMGRSKAKYKRVSSSTHPPSYMCVCMMMQATVDLGMCTADSIITLLWQ